MVHLLFLQLAINGLPFSVAINGSPFDANKNTLRPHLWVIRDGDRDTALDTIPRVSEIPYRLLHQLQQRLGVQP